MSIDIERWNTDPKYRAAYKGEVCRHCGWPPGECICLAGPSVPSTDPPAVLLRDTPEGEAALHAAVAEAMYEAQGKGYVTRDAWMGDDGNLRHVAAVWRGVLAALRGRNAGFYDDPNAEGNDR